MVLDNNMINNNLWNRQIYLSPKKQQNIKKSVSIAKAGRLHRSVYRTKPVTEIGYGLPLREFF